MRKIKPNENVPLYGSYIAGHYYVLLVTVRENEARYYNKLCLVYNYVHIRITIVCLAQLCTKLIVLLRFSKLLVCKLSLYDPDQYLCK